MRQTGRRSSDSHYSLEVRCTRCKEMYVKEVRAGHRLTQRRVWWGDTRGMCSLCKFKTTAVFFAVIIPVALVLGIIVL